ncbi:MAG: GNAT family N-acetyltransferase [Eudoraea sp.]|nr:GNAT family N-acetyltransferase [Eudoraea sp.]
MEIRILQGSDVTTEMERQISLLMDQLNPQLKPRGLSETITDANNLYILCALEGDEVLGMASLAIYQVLSGKKGWIEDVVVDQNYRRKGVARILTEELIRLGRELGLDQLLLYTGAHRTAAHQLYEACGFIRKNSYQYILFP